MRDDMEFHQIGWDDDIERVGGRSGECRFRARQRPIEMFHSIRYVFDKNVE